MTNQKQANLIVLGDLADKIIRLHDSSDTFRPPTNPDVSRVIVRTIQDMKDQHEGLYLDHMRILADLMDVTLRDAI